MRAVGGGERGGGKGIEGGRRGRRDKGVREREGQGEWGIFIERKRRGGGKGRGIILLEGGGGYGRGW